MSKKPFKILLLGDLHCGHIAGLTPTSYQMDKERNPNVSALQKEMWKEFKAILKKVGEVDLCICNGDAIDGNGYRNGGVECITTDMEEQIAIARKVLQTVATKQYALTYGTASHTSITTDWERLLADQLDSPIKNHLFIEKYGVTLSVKHHLGSSGIPHGRHTAIAKEKMWNLYWNEIGQVPKADIFVRSHVHYHQYCGGATHLAMTLPALQSAHTAYGARRCSGVVDFGAVELTIKPNGEYTWKSHVTRLQNIKQETIKY